MRRNTIGLTAAALVAAGVVGVSGAAIAAAADDTAATPSTSSTAPTAPPGGGSGRAGGAQDTAVTGSEADKVIAAVKAEDSSATITTVRKDPDGSYDALGTKAGSPVFFDVSADLKTVTARTGGPGGHGGPGGGGPQDTAVTGSEADKVIAAVKAEDSSATITTVRKDPDGSYDALGTKAGSPVFFEVSADLKTVTARTGGPGGPGGHGGPDGATGSLPGGSSTGTTSSGPTDANTASVV
jgi:hypothetical protein